MLYKDLDAEPNEEDSACCVEAPSERRPEPSPSRALCVCLTANKMR